MPTKIVLTKHFQEGTLLIDKDQSLVSDLNGRHGYILQLN